MAVEYDKLVRDNIPEIIKSANASPVTHIAEDEEFVLKLREKLQEEVAEFLKADSNRDRIQELADILEVAQALGEVAGINQQELERAREKKARERGRFEKRIILERVL